MNYKDLTSYKLLIDLGCYDETGPIQAKKGIVKLTIYGLGSTPGRGFVQNPYYHFDPNYNDNGKISAKAKVVSTFNSNFIIYIKEKDDNPLVDYDLAFLSFVFNFFGKKKIKTLTYESINILFSKNKKTIFERVFK